MAERQRFAVVIPTVGRPSLGTLLASLSRSAPHTPDEIIVVDDRDERCPALAVTAGDVKLRILTSGGRGPAAARNVGWRATEAPWVAFLDDDVEPLTGWAARLAADLSALPQEVAGSQGRIAVPLPVHRRPTDWERNTAALEEACWATADMAYRRDVLEEIGGFDERFPRAFREDADLGLRVCAAGYLIVRGERRVCHPVRTAPPTVSIQAQAGNADDVLMLALHGPGWRTRAAAEGGRTGRHLLTTAAGALAAIAALAGRRRSAAAAATGWALGTGELAWARLRPGPRSPGELVTMVATSLVLPAAATRHWLAGWLRLPRLLARGSPGPLGPARNPLALAPALSFFPTGRRIRPGPADPSWSAEAVLFDRDGTLVVDVPYNTDPALVALMPGARQAVRRARQAGLRTGVVTNQSGVGTGRITPDQLLAVNRRVEELLGPFDTWAVCTHRPDEGCGCRKPSSGLIESAAAALGVAPQRCAVIGDIGADMKAAQGAGARGVLVPSRSTRRPELAAARAVAPDLLRAVDYVLAGTC